MEWLLGTPAGLLRVAVSAVVVYVAVVLMLRWGGHRTLASLRAFDFIVVVAIGTLAASALLQQAPLAHALLAILLLVLLQTGVAWAGSRSRRFHEAVTAAPILLVHKGRLLEEGMRRARVTRDDVLLALRRHGHHDLADVGAVVLETNGDLSVLKSEEGAALANVERR